MRNAICLFVLMTACYDIGTIASFSDEEERYTVEVYANAREFYKIPAHSGLIESNQGLVDNIKKSFSSNTDFVLGNIDYTRNLHAYCFRNNDRFHALYDTNMNIAGVRIGLVEEDLESKMKSNRDKSLKFPINYDHNGMYTKGRGWSSDYYYTDILFGEPNLFWAPHFGHDNQWRFQHKIDTIVMKLDGGWNYLPTQECDAELYGFTKQGCWQGQYYFYRMTKDSDCKDLSGVFVFFEDGKLLGVGVMAFGSYSTYDRAWFEDLTEKEIRRIVPNSPPCFIDWFRKYGLSPIHIFFKKPKMSTCTMFGGKATDCSIHHQQYSQGDQGDESYYDGEDT